MHFIPVIISALLVSLAAAIPVQSVNAAVPATVHKHWTIDGVVRQRFNHYTTCKWHLEIQQFVVTMTDNSTTGIASTSASDPVSCDFLVQAHTGYDCGFESFGPTKCNMANHGFYVNGGHNENGFVVMVVENVDDNAQAYFGFLDSALNGGTAIPAQTSPVKDIDYNTNVSLLARDDGPEYGEKWVIPRLLRRVHPDTNSVEIEFPIITDVDDIVFPCSLNIEAPWGINVATWEWYDRECKESGWYVSWGYMKGSDAGIMTLVNPARDHRAFFGFVDISKSEIMDSHEAPIEPCECGAPSY
ncbi:hypothetical protein GQX73_g7725 [Xylaria multiplex]|uniref:Uncharacterized protein n=1 Tax=Xylaria multiplex TaxID=323545 RepID=A0A7C8MNW8_9PEZI|nr:hypothetical protein GQX73_g7725 [Xylaria multiplex]